VPSLHRPKEDPNVYRIEIDRNECIGYGLCAQTAPRSLRLDADGLAIADSTLVDDEDVVEAALVCPMAAIRAERIDELAAA
jgi:ferredoxin